MKTNGLKKLTLGIPAHPGFQDNAFKCQTANVNRALVRHTRNRC